MHRPRVILSLALVLSLCACSRSANPAPRQDGLETLVLRYEGNTNNVSIPELAEDLGYLAPVKLQYMGNNSTGGPHSIQAVVTGDIDIGSSFNGAIIKLIAAGAPIRSVLASYGTDSQTFSGFYTLEGSPIRGAKGLVGKKIAMNTLGAHSEFVLKEYLLRGGVTAEQAKQVTMVVLPPVNCELALRNQQVDVVAFTTLYRDRASERGGIRMLFSDHEMIGSFNAGSYVMTKKFLETKPNTARKFVQAAGRAIAWARSTPREQVIARFTAIVSKRKRNEDTSVLRHWRSYGIASEHGELTDKDFAIWVDWLVADGQLAKGQLKLTDLYSNAYQPQSRSLAAK
jgi:ABC-type nitrate/sulfonate/bicarbonate transport system substrate-binding protein